MRNLIFNEQEDADGVVRRRAKFGSVEVATFPSSSRGATIYVSLSTYSRAIASGHGPEDDDAITEAEALLRRDHPLAWQVYAAHVLVNAGTDEATGVAA